MQTVYDWFWFLDARVVSIVLHTAGALLALVILLKAVRILFRRAERRMLAAGKDVTPLRYLRYVVKAAVYVVCIAAALRNVPGMNTVMTSLLAGSGIVAVMVGLASQQALGNIVSGLILLAFRPFKIGDRVRYHGGDVRGVIEEIGIRHTEIRTEEGTQVLIPNGLMNSNVVELLK
ncbi:MAG: mechanosensitive ion channel family protein [Oscillospiraceae bacterium]|nr:mechanosensitive ion channel family protein [Oscillospiraceae bacterium]